MNTPESDEPPPTMEPQPFDESVGSPAAPLPKPRVWTVVVTLVVDQIMVYVFAIVAMAITLIPQIRNISSSEERRQAIIGWARSPAGAFSMLVPIQAATLLTAFWAAWESPYAIAPRLGLVRGRWPIWTWSVLALATPVCSLVGVLISETMPSRATGSLELLMQMIDASEGGRAILVLAAICILPGIAEEMLFRGYVQRRLIERWGASVAITITALCFAAVHHNMRQSVSVVPVSVWLGVVAWRTGSILPSMVCHAVNNLAAVFIMRSIELNAGNVQLNAPEALLLLISTAAMVYAVTLLRRGPTQQNASA